MEVVKIRFPKSTSFSILKEPPVQEYLPWSPKSSQSSQSLSQKSHHTIHSSLPTMSYLDSASVNSHSWLKSNFSVSLQQKNPVSLSLQQCSLKSWNVGSLATCCSSMQVPDWNPIPNHEFRIPVADSNHDLNKGLLCSTSGMGKKEEKPIRTFDLKAAYAESTSRMEFIIDGKRQVLDSELNWFEKPGYQTPENPPYHVIAPDQRVVAVGDLHGDWDQTRSALQLAGLLSTDNLNRWTGGSTILVQVGDVLDRGGDEIAIMSLLRHLASQAKECGGAVFQVNGNHETMNVAEDFRYVSEEGFVESELFVRYTSDFFSGDFRQAFSHWWEDSQAIKMEGRRTGGWSWNPILAKKRLNMRSMLFGVGGPLANELARNPVALKVNDTLFAHGGVLPHHVEYGLERMNRELSDWMRGTLTPSGLPAPMPYMATKGYNSVVWSRLYSQESFQSLDDRIKACSVLVSALNAAGASRLVVGHTPQMVGANSECNGRVWRIDVGMSSGIMNASPQVLEIVRSSVRILGAQDLSILHNYV